MQKALTIEDLEKLKHSWTATVLQNNGFECQIWYTALPSMKHIINKVISVASDYPKHILKNKS